MSVTQVFAPVLVALRIARICHLCVVLHQLPIRSEREQDLDQTGADKPLRRDRGPSKAGLDRRKLAIQTGQRVIHDLPDLAQGMAGRDPRLKVHIAEK